MMRKRILIPRAAVLLPPPRAYAPGAKRPAHRNRGGHRDPAVGRSAVPDAMAGPTREARSA